MYNAILYTITVCVWGSTWLAIKYQVGDIPAIQSVFYRFMIAAVLLQLFLILTKRIKIYNLQAHKLFAILGLCLFGVNYLLFYLAAEYGLTTGIEAVIFSFLISMNILNNALFFKEKPDRNVLIGATIGILGILALFQNELYELINGTAIGIGVLFSIVATYLASLGNMASKKLQRLNINVISANAWGMTYGVVFLFTIALLTTDHFQFSFENSYLISLGILAILGSIVAFGAYLTLLGRIGADRAAYATIVFPVIALILSSIYESYEWSILKIFGIILIIVGNLVILGKIKFQKQLRMLGSIDPNISKIARQKSPHLNKRTSNEKRF